MVFSLPPAVNTSFVRHRSHDNQSISRNDYQQVQDALGTAADDSGLVGVLHHYLASLTPDPSVKNPAPPQTYWPDARDQFTAALPAFQQKGLEWVFMRRPPTWY